MHSARVLLFIFFSSFVFVKNCPDILQGRLVDVVCSAGKTVLSVAKVTLIPEKQKNHIRPVHPVEVSALQNEFSFGGMLAVNLLYCSVDFLIRFRRLSLFFRHLPLNDIGCADDTAEFVALKTGAAG